jgi:hypothetical protein
MGGGHEACTRKRNLSGQWGNSAESPAKYGEITHSGRLKCEAQAWWNACALAHKHLPIPALTSRHWKTSHEERRGEVRC